MKNNTKLIILLNILIAIFIFFSVRFIMPYFFPNYASDSFAIDFDDSRVIPSIIFYVIIWLFCIKEYFIFKKTNKISCIIGFCLNYIYFLPGILMGGFYVRTIDYIWTFFIYSFVFNFLILFISKKNKTKPIFQMNNFDSTLICIGITVFLLIISLINTGFKIDVLNVFNKESVYSHRAEYDMTESSPILWYFIIFGATIIPTWACIALKNKQYLFVALYALTVAAMYSISNNRMYLFIFSFAILFYIFKKSKNLMIWFFLLLWFIPIIEFWIGNDYLLTDVIRRLSFTPNSISYFHYDFFKTNEPDYLRQALNMYFGRLGIASPYENKIATMIGLKYFNTEVNANVGLLGGNFANYGYYSIILGPIGYVIFLYILDCFFAKEKSNVVLYATAFTIAFSATNYETFIETIVTPSWLLFYVVFMFVLPRSKESMHKITHIF